VIDNRIICLAVAVVILLGCFLAGFVLLAIKDAVIGAWVRWWKGRK
jgi:hypothetical protein